jgi:hemolysin activation/secretion protein
MIASLASPATLALDPGALAGPPPVVSGLERVIDVAEYQVEGATQLSDAEVEEAVTPFLGPGRSLADLERARAALEKAYLDHGYQAVSVAIPPQKVRDGIVTIKVTEGKVGRLRVRGARYFSLNDIKQQAPSVAEGRVPNFNDIVRDLTVLNQLPDRRVIPAVRAGAVPGTVDVDLMVQDTFPLHGSLEAHNRHGASTTATRSGGSLRYDNLWQAGHSLGLSFQVAPERFKDGTILSGYYSARLPDHPGVTLSLNGILQDSDVSTLGNVAVQGRGHVLGGRAVFALSSASDFLDNVSVGLDYKRYREVISLGESKLSAPVTYWPVTAQYTAIWSRAGSQTQLVAGLTFNLRGLSSDADGFENKRYRSTGAFVFWKGELSRSDELGHDVQLAERVEAQYTIEPLIGSEQLTAGGAESVPGYLEAQVTGDRGATARIELASPSLTALFGRPAVREWRFLLIAAGAGLNVNDPLPDQARTSWLWGAGAGTRLKLWGGLRAEVDVGVPLRTSGAIRRYEPALHFHVMTEF